MAALTFDTLRFMRTLESAGIPSAQAEAFSKAFKEASGEAELVTKRDLDKTVAELKFDLLKWIVGLSLAQMGLLAGLLIKISA